MSSLSCVCQLCIIINIIIPIITTSSQTGVESLSRKVFIYSFVYFVQILNLSLEHGIYIVKVIRST